MITNDAFKALSQVSDPKFLSVFFRGVGLSLILLVLITMGILWLLPNTISLPWLGELAWLTPLLDGFAVISMIMLSIFLMIPVASLFIGLFLDQVMDAVEAKHYPSVGPARKVSIGETTRESLKFLGLMIAVNMLAFAIYFFLPLAFWIVNGVMLGREYFQMVAMRRVGRKEAKRLRRSHWLHISFAGTLMAVPLTVPLLNLIIPILGVAMFTHLFHRLVAT